MSSRHGPHRRTGQVQILSLMALGRLSPKARILTFERFGVSVHILFDGPLGHFYDMQAECVPPSPSPYGKSKIGAANPPGCKTLNR